MPPRKGQLGRGSWAGTGHVVPHESSGQLGEYASPRALGAHRLPSLLGNGSSGPAADVPSLSPPAGMNALQLQNLATLAAAAAAAQTSATTTNANPLSTTSSALGALTSPGKGWPCRWETGRGGRARCRVDMPRPCQARDLVTALLYLSF